MGKSLNTLIHKVKEDCKNISQSPHPVIANVIYLGSSVISRRDTG